MGLNENPQGVASFHEIFGGPTPKSMGKKTGGFCGSQEFFGKPSPKRCLWFGKGIVATFRASIHIYIYIFGKMYRIICI